MTSVSSGQTSAQSPEAVGIEPRRPFFGSPWRKTWPLRTPYPPQSLAWQFDEYERLEMTATPLPSPPVDERVAAMSQRFYEVEDEMKATLRLLAVLEECTTDGTAGAAGYARAISLVRVRRDTLKHFIATGDWK